MRLQAIDHRKPDTSTLSRFDYTYDVAGNILTWQQQADSDAPTVWRYGYDRADQLTAAVHQTTGTTPTIIKRYAYSYDPVGNRTSEQIDDDVTVDTHDSLNRILTKSAGGMLTFSGTVNEPARVTINGKPAPVDATNAFSTGVPVAAGTTTVTINAVDASGNAAEAVYEVDQAGTGKTFTYDANGNMTSDGMRTFEWDARNQLVAVNVGTHRSEFVYDGLQRRVQELEKENGVIQTDTRVIWCDSAICEERAADGITVTRRAYSHGEQVASAAQFFAADHLGSVHEVTDSISTLLARYAFDPWGRRTVAAGTDVTTDGFTGHRTHTRSGLALALYRGYDADLAGWLNQDPIGLRGGPNLYGYAGGNPIRNNDPLGLEIGCVVSQVDERLVGQCPPGAGACTNASMYPLVRGCEQDSCGKWRFRATVDIRYVITYSRRKNDRAPDGNTYERHEWLHIIDLQTWCTRLPSIYPSEGFKSPQECNAARRRFYKEVFGAFGMAQEASTRARDRR